MEWLPGTSVTVAPVRSAMDRWAGGGIILSSVTTRYQLGLIRQAASEMVPPRACTPQGTWESAMNAAWAAGRSPAKEAWNLSRSRNRNPSAGGQDRRLRPVGREPGDEGVGRLALVGGERGDVDQGGDLVVQA